MRTISIRKGLSVAPGPGDSGAQNQSSAEMSVKKMHFNQTQPPPLPALLSITDKDYPDVRPDLQVNLSERVKQGQLLFTDKKNHNTHVFSDVDGVVSGLELGSRRSLRKLEIKVNQSNVPACNTSNAEAPQCYKLDDETIALINSDDREKMREGLIQAGLFSAFRTRPFNRIPDTRTLEPQHIFVTAMDTNPYAPLVREVFEGCLRYFQSGLETISKLTDGNVYVCQAPGFPLAEESNNTIRNIAFEGPHPAGNASTHIQALYPISRQRLVWVIDYQEVIAIGRASSTGLLSSIRLISIVNAATGQITITRAITGSDIKTLLSDTRDSNSNEETRHTPVDSSRFWSGDAFSGNWSSHLGRFDRQIFINLPSPADSSTRPGGFFDKLLQKIGANRTRTSSSPPPLIAEPWLDTVSPLTDSTTALLRSLICGDMETAEACGCLKFVEEDISPLESLTGNRYGFPDLLRACHRHIENELVSA